MANRYLQNTASGIPMPIHHHKPLDMDKIICNRYKTQDCSLTYREKEIIEESLNTSSKSKITDQWTVTDAMASTLLGGDYKVFTYEMMGPTGNSFGRTVIYLMTGKEPGQVIKIDPNEKALTMWVGK